jgi:hypothetical protein
MTKEAKQALHSMMDDLHEQIQNHPKKDDDEFKTSGYAMIRAMRMGEPLVFQNVRTGESSEKMSDADGMLAKELGERILDLLADNSVDTAARSFHIHMAALDHAFDKVVNIHDPSNVMPLAMEDDTAPNLEKIAHQIMHKTSNNGEIFPENNALACIIVAAGWLACADDVTLVDENVRGLSDFVANLVQKIRDGTSAEFEKEFGVTFDPKTGDVIKDVDPPVEH